MIGEDTGIPSGDVRVGPATGEVGATERTMCRTSASQSIATRREDERTSQRAASANSRGPRAGRGGNEIDAKQGGGSETITAAATAAAADLGVEDPSSSRQPSPPSPPIFAAENRREALG